MPEGDGIASASVICVSYCDMLVLRKDQFDRVMAECRRFRRNDSIDRGIACAAAARTVAAERRAGDEKAREGHGGSADPFGAGGANPRESGVGRRMRAFSSIREGAPAPAVGAARNPSERWRAASRCVLKRTETGAWAIAPRGSERKSTAAHCAFAADVGAPSPIPGRAAFGDPLKHGAN